jgi:AraC-like DNA-binding protein
MNAAMLVLELQLYPAQPSGVGMDREGKSLISRDVWIRLAYYRRTARLVEHLRLHPADPLNLEHAASLACMERTAFSRFFKRHIGLTFSDFLRAYRVSRAIREMQLRNASFEEIANAVGFNCVKTFERSFKKETGMNPSRFRARQRARRGVSVKTASTPHPSH